ncbi:hypothetical protein [Thalassobacillus pellis]|uniref:hypothetical protein n=1 Tax=Thalassobacillus pellis TaxID=748008 RepID=UPI001960E3E3|nr:hypothetical protein [Thalassobacillus pellis]MBM7551860.1 hypothetical protein [Thalassobacillus pellis]
MYHTRSFYEALPDEILGRFYYEFIISFEKGNGNNAMFRELQLIKGIAAERGIPLDQLLKIGTP